MSSNCARCGHHVKSHWPDPPHECWGIAVGDCSCRAFRLSIDSGTVDSDDQPPTASAATSHT